MTARIAVEPPPSFLRFEVPRKFLSVHLNPSFIDYGARQVMPLGQPATVRYPPGLALPNGKLSTFKTADWYASEGVACFFTAV